MLIKVLHPKNYSFENILILILYFKKLKMFALNNYMNYKYLESISSIRQYYITISIIKL